MRCATCAELSHGHAGAIQTIKYGGATHWYAVNRKIQRGYGQPIKRGTRQTLCGINLVDS